MNTATIERLSIPEKLLLAAHQLEESGQSPFSAEALAVAAWEKFPKTFGLKGYSDKHPDCNKVNTYVMGEKGLIRRGQFAKLGQKLYQLTRDGRQRVRELLEQESAPPQPAKLTQALADFLRRLLDHRTTATFRQGLKMELTFADACQFWGISEGDNGRLGSRMDEFAKNLESVCALVGDQGADLPDGRHVSADDVRQLRAVDDYLRERFSRHLHLLVNRGERKAVGVC